MERRAGGCAARSERIPLEEGIKANRHKAIDRGRSSRSLMAWKNSESQLTLRYGLGAGRGSCVPDTRRLQIENTTALPRVRGPHTFSNSLPTRQLLLLLHHHHLLILLLCSYARPFLAALG